MYNQRDATFLNLFISLRRSTCFRRVFRPSSGAQNCTYSVRYLSDRYCSLVVLSEYITEWPLPFLPPEHKTEFLSPTNKSDVCNGRIFALTLFLTYVEVLLVASVVFGIRNTNATAHRNVGCRIRKGRRVIYK